MDGLRNVVAVLALFTIAMSFMAPSLAQMQSTPMTSSTMIPVEQSDRDMMAAMTDTKDTGMAASIMKKAGLESMIKPEGTYTLFVASDTALATSPTLMNKMMDKVKDRQMATEFVNGHLVSGMVMPDEMTDGKMLALMNGKTMKVRVTDGRMMVDNANIIKAVKTDNGMIYVMDRIPSSIWTMMADIGLVPMTAMPVSG